MLIFTKERLINLSSNHVTIKILVKYSLQLHFIKINYKFNYFYF